MTQARLELLADSSGIRAATNDLKNLERQSGVTESKTKKSFSGVGRSAGQAGIQIQQFVGQVQGGQNALLALSQQATDLGIVLGAPLIGVIAGLGASLVSFLIPSIVNTDDKIKELVKGIKELREESNITSAQAALLSQDQQKQAEAIGKRTQAIAEEIKELTKLNEARTSAGVGTDTGQFAVPRTAEQNQKRYADQIKKTEERLVELRAELDLQNQKLIKVNDSIEQIGSETGKTAESILKLRDSLKAQNVTLTEGELAGSLYAAAQATGAKSVDELDGEIRSLITSIYNAEQAKRNEIIATREQVQANRDLIAGLQEEQRVRQAFFSLQSQLAAENNPAEQARQQLQARLDVIREFYGLESNEQALQYAAGVDAEKSYQEQLAKIRKTGADQYQQQQINTLGYTSQFFGTLAQIAEAGGKDSFDSYKLLASAQAGIAAAMAVLQVYADPSITNTYLKIGLAGAIAGLAGAQIKQIQSAEYSGARALGGQVIGGNSYLVGERGPEIITAGSNGNVTPFNQLMSEAREGSASPNFSVNIVNNGSAMVETSQPRFSQEDRAWVLDVFVSDMDRRGRSFGAIKRNTTASGRTI